jgi:hypothetical protein
LLHALCGIAAACTVASQPARVAEPTAALQSPPQLIAVEQRTVVTRPRHKSAARNPPARLYRRTLNQETGCDVYNCVGPRTDFRLPNEIPYPEYEQQFTGRASAR